MRSIVLFVVFAIYFVSAQYDVIWTCENAANMSACNALVNNPSIITPTFQEMGGAVQIGCTWQSGVYDNVVYFMGGSTSNDGSGASGSMWSLNLTSNVWRFLGPGATELVNSAPVYSNAPNEPSANIYPGSRLMSYCWNDGPNLLLFGGYNIGYFIADLWAFNEFTEVWSWMSGQQLNDNVDVSPGNIGPFQNFSVSYLPPGRLYGAWWFTAATPELRWLHGGQSGSASATDLYFLADVWALNVTNLSWAWVAGPTTINAPGIYSGSTEYPGGRMGQSAWATDEGAVYIFGGYGNDQTGTGLVYLNDLWVFDVLTWEFTFLAGCPVATDECCLGGANYPTCRMGQVVAPSLQTFPMMYIIGGSVSSFVGSMWAINVTSALGIPYSWTVGPAPHTEGTVFQDMDGTPFIFGGGQDEAFGGLYSLQICEEGCLKCTMLASRVCLLCDSANGFALNPLTLTCATTCPDGYYLDHNTTTCEVCTFGCDTCVAPGLEYGACLTCNATAGYVLSPDNNTCVEHCGDGTFKGPTTCQACSVGCSLCDASGLAYPATCQMCNRNEGYFLNLNETECVDTCANAEFEHDMSCYPCTRGCWNCTAAGLSVPGSCLACDGSVGYLLSLNGSSCVSSCGPFQNATGAQCTCATGAFLSGFTCTACTTGCDVCSGAGLSNAVCFACNRSAGFVWAANGSACVSACSIGYFKASMSCQHCAIGCANCTGAGVGAAVCSACNNTAGYVWSLDGSRCVATCPVGYKGPTSCQACSVGCSQCSGLGLEYPGTCQACNVSAGYLLNANQSACAMGCPPREFSSNGACVEGCANCSGPGLDLPVCEACDQSAGYFLALNRTTCVSTCDSGEVESTDGCACLPAFYPVSGVCIACPAGCQTCMETTLGQPPSCTACQQGYVLSAGECSLQSTCAALYRSTNGHCELNVALIGGVGGGALALFACLTWIACMRCRQRTPRDKSPMERPLLDPLNSELTRVNYDTTNATLNLVTSASGSSGSTSRSIQVGGVAVTQMEDLEVLASLGEGGFATVCQVQHKRNYTMMALKQFMQSSAEQVSLFVDEATVMFNLHHPCCLRCLGIVFDVNRPQQMGMLTEYMPGGDLASRMSKPIDWSEKVSILLKICQGLSYLHEQKLVHRDLKPGNVLLDGKGGVVVADFGLVNYKGHAFTPRYAPPEVIRGALGNGASDVFSLGVLGLELLAVKSPLDSRTTTTIASNTGAPDVTTTGISAHVYEARGRPVLEALLTRCTRVNPDDRPALDELLAAIVKEQRILEGTTTIIA